MTDIYFSHPQYPVVSRPLMTVIHCVRPNYPDLTLVSELAPVPGINARTSGLMLKLCAGSLLIPSELPKPKPFNLSRSGNSQSWRSLDT